MLNHCVLWADSRLFRFVTGKGKEGVGLLPKSAGFAGSCPDNTGSVHCHSQHQVCIMLPMCKEPALALLPAGPLIGITSKAWQRILAHVAHILFPAEGMLRGIWLG